MVRPTLQVNVASPVNVSVIYVTTYPASIYPSIVYVAIFPTTTAVLLLGVQGPQLSAIPSAGVVSIAGIPLGQRHSVTRDPPELEIYSNDPAGHTSHIISHVQSQVSHIPPTF